MAYASKNSLNTVLLSSPPAPPIFTSHLNKHWCIDGFAQPASPQSSIIANTLLLISFFFVTSRRLSARARPLSQSATTRGQAGTLITAASGSRSLRWLQMCLADPQQVFLPPQADLFCHAVRLASEWLLCREATTCLLLKPSGISESASTS